MKGTQGTNPNTAAEGRPGGSHPRLGCRLGSAGSQGVAPHLKMASGSAQAVDERMVRVVPVHAACLAASSLPAPSSLLTLHSTEAPCQQL